jgi:hypothetical protein
MVEFRGAESKTARLSLWPTMLPLDAVTTTFRVVRCEVNAHVSELSAANSNEAAPWRGPMDEIFPHTH